MSELSVNHESLPIVEEDLIFGIFENTRVYFVALLILVVFIYVLIFSIVGNGNSVVNTGESSSFMGKNIYVLMLELVLWISLIVIIYINISNYDKQNYNFRASLEKLFNTKLAELEVNVENDSPDSNNNNENNTSDQSNDNSGNNEVFHIAENVSV